MLAQGGHSEYTWLGSNVFFGLSIFFVSGDQEMCPVKNTPFLKGGGGEERGGWL